MSELCFVVFMQFLSGFKFQPLDRPLTTYDKFEFVDENISEEKEVLRVKAEFDPIDKSSIKTIAEGKVGWLGRGTSGVATQQHGCTGVVFSHPTLTSCPPIPFTSPQPPPPHARAPSIISHLHLIAVSYQLTVITFVRSSLMHDTFIFEKCSTKILIYLHCAGVLMKCTLVSTGLDLWQEQGSSDARALPVEHSGCGGSLLRGWQLSRLCPAYRHLGSGRSIQRYSK